MSKNSTAIKDKDLKDNNDDNEFSTGNATDQMPRRQQAVFSGLKIQLNQITIKMGNFLEQSGKKLQTMGQTKVVKMGEKNENAK